MAVLYERMIDDLLTDVKANLILQHDEDDALLRGVIAAAVDYAAKYQHIERYKSAKAMTPSTRQAVVMLSSHWYESRDGSTGGFFADNVNAAKQVSETVNALLRIDRVWKA